jgi:hypothetical protein
LVFTAIRLLLKGMSHVFRNNKEEGNDDKNYNKNIMQKP